MSQSYFQFSFELDGNCWTKEAIEMVRSYINSETNIIKDLFNNDRDDYYGHSGYTCFEMEDNIIFAEENGNLDLCVEILQHVMQKFNFPSSYFMTISAAYTSNKMCPESFGGDMVVFNKHFTRYFNPMEFIDESKKSIIEEMNKANLS